MVAYCTIARLFPRSTVPAAPGPKLSRPVPQPEPMSLGETEPSRIFVFSSGISHLIRNLFRPTTAVDHGCCRSPPAPTPRGSLRNPKSAIRNRKVPHLNTPQRAVTPRERSESRGLAVMPCFSFRFPGSGFRVLCSAFCIVLPPPASINPSEPPAFWYIRFRRPPLAPA